MGALLAWLAGREWDGSHLMEDGRFRGDVRMADIDNDGADELVLSATELRTAAFESGYAPP